MILDADLRARLQFLARVVRRECSHLQSTDSKLFSTAFTSERVQQLQTDGDLAERVEAFVSRYGRLQDTIANKLLPSLLEAIGEPSGAVIDNLDRAERLEWLDSVADWMAARRIRIQMVHEYIEDAELLASALQAGHRNVPMLVSAAEAMRDELAGRGWLDDELNA